MVVPVSLFVAIYFANSASLSKQQSILNLVAIAKSRRLFRLQHFRILTRPKVRPKPQKKITCVQMETANDVDCGFAHRILCCILQKQHGFME